jgi:hypothetical protein
MEVLRWIHVLAWRIPPVEGSPQRPGHTGADRRPRDRRHLHRRRADEGRRQGAHLRTHRDPGHRRDAGRGPDRAVAGIVVRAAAPRRGAMDGAGAGGGAVRRRLPGVQPGRHPLFRPAGGPRLHGQRVARGGADPAGLAVRVRPPGRRRRRAQRHPVGAPPRPRSGGASRQLSAGGGRAPPRRRSRGRTADRGTPGANPRR